MSKINFSLGMSSVKEIDKYNILEATKISMRRAVKKLNQIHAQLIIDGNIDLVIPKLELDRVSGNMWTHTPC